jgi:NAD+--asparagine ADP-ribosyltransferase
MGQEFSSRHLNSIFRPKDKMSKKQRMELWKQIKDQELNHLREKATETEKEFKKLRKQIDCHSFLLKEIFEDRLREERKNQMTEMQKMSNEIEILKKELINMKRKRK